MARPRISAESFSIWQSSGTARAAWKSPRSDPVSISLEAARLVVPQRLDDQLGLAPPLAVEGGLAGTGAGGDGVHGQGVVADLAQQVEHRGVQLASRSGVSRLRAMVRPPVVPVVTSFARTSSIERNCFVHIDGTSPPQRNEIVSLRVLHHNRVARHELPGPSRAEKHWRVSDDVAYLRFPHLHGDLLCFAAEDDLWVAPLVPDGHRPGRAWRVTVDRTRVGHPRFSPDGTPHRLHDLAQPRPRDPSRPGRRRAGPPAHLLGQHRHPGLRLDAADRDEQSHILAVVLARPAVLVLLLGLQRPHRRLPRREAALGPGRRHRGRRHRRRAPHPAADRHPAARTGRLEAVPGRRDGPAVAARRAAAARARRPSGRPDVRRRPDRLPLRPRGRRQPLLLSATTAPICAATPTTTHFYARHASSDGARVVYQCAGDLWLVDDLSPGRRAAQAGRPARRPARRAAYATRCRPPSHVDGARPWTRRAGPAPSCVRGSLYWLTHRDGPARTIADTPGVRVRLPEMLGCDRPGRLRHGRGGRGRDRDRLPAARQRRPASRAGWPPGSWAGSRSWSPTRTANGSRSPRTTAACCSGGRAGRRDGSDRRTVDRADPLRSTAPSATWRSRPTAPG